MDRGVLYTLKELMLRPGQLIRDYIEGRRAHHVKPLLLVMMVTALVTLVVILAVTVLAKGLLGRLSILIGVLTGYLVACLRGEVDFDAVDSAAWIGLPHFASPSFSWSVVPTNS